MALQFFECPNCQKSLRVGARACHHCHAVDENDWADPHAATEFAEGGYLRDDYDADNQGHNSVVAKWWRRIVFVVVLLLLLSFLLQVVAFPPPPSR